MEFPRRRRGEGHEPVIPLINIIFLLLIFFLVTGTLRSAELLEIDPPRAGGGANADANQPTLSVAADGRLAFAGQLLVLTDLHPHLAAAGADGVPPDHIIVRADGRVHAERLLEVMETLRASGVQEISLITELEAGT